MFTRSGPSTKAYALPIEKLASGFFVCMGVEGFRVHFGPYPTRQSAVEVRNAILTNPHLWKDYGGKRNSVSS